MTRAFLALTLSLLVAAPAPAAAQIVRVTLGSPLTGAPAVSAPIPLALPSGALPAPVMAPLSASIPALPAPAIAAAAVPAALAAPALAASMRSAPSAVPGPAPERSAEERKAAADAAFDGSIASEGVSAVAVPAERPRRELELKLSALGRAPAPRPWLEKAKVVAAYGALTAGAVALHAPFDHIGPMIVGAIFSPMLSFMGLFFYAVSKSAVSGAPLEGEGVKPSGETTAMVARLAVEAKVRVPARVTVLPGGKVQAQVGSLGAAGYEIRYTKAFESLRPEVQESILRHEFAHVRHHDTRWHITAAVLAPLAPMLGMLALDGKTTPEIIAYAAIAVAAALLLPGSMRRSEYLADQYAASKPEGAGPLARFFVEDSENPERVASALSGTAFASETGWKRRAISSWDWAKHVFNAHPSHDRRLARLARLAKQGLPLGVSGAILRP